MNIINPMQEVEAHRRRMGLRTLVIGVVIYVLCGLIDLYYSRPQTHDQKPPSATQLRPGVESHMAEDCGSESFPITCEVTPEQYVLDQKYPPTKEADEFGPALYQYVVIYGCDGRVISAERAVR